MMTAAKFVIISMQTCADWPVEIVLLRTDKAFIDELLWTWSDSRKSYQVSVEW